MKRVLLAGAAFALLVLSSPSLQAAPDPPPDPRGEARERFDRALRLFEEGDNAGALAEFRRVNDLSPNRLVLFNIGMVYAAMNRPVEAADTLEQVLKDPGPLAADRLALARSTLERQITRIGFVVVTTNTPAAIEVDGIEVGRTPEQSRFRVPSGTHVVGALAAGHLPSRREVTVAGASTAEVSFTLAPTESSLAHLEVSSPVPGAAVLIDGALAGFTPLPASLAVPPGTHVIELRRPGFLSARREMSLGERTSGQLHLDLEEDQGAPAAHRGTLVLKASESEASLSVNGRPRGVDPGPLSLPAGPHRLRVERPGFLPVEREVLVPAASALTTKVTLLATPETRLAHVARVRGRARTGWAVTGVGAAVAIAAGGTALWAHTGLPDARTHLEVTRQGQMRMGGGECDPARALSNAMLAICNERLAGAEDDLSRRKLFRTLGLVGAGVGLAAIAVGSYLLLSGEDAGRYDQPGTAAPLTAVSWQPLGWVNAGGGGLGLGGRF